MNGKLNVKTIINFDHVDILNKLYTYSTFSNMSFPFYGVHLVEVGYKQLYWTMDNFLMLTKIY